jgi:pimeloyl-ACP methyl ester carboxylesterase
MRQEIAVDGFRLAYERTGRGPGVPAVLLLHGWPGDLTGYREIVPLLSAAADVGPVPARRQAHPLTGPEAESR